MKLAATRALAELAKQDVPDSVCRIYGVKRMEFGRKYIIPTTAFDPRVLVSVATAVARAQFQAALSASKRMPMSIGISWRNGSEPRKVSCES